MINFSFDPSQYPLHTAVMEALNLTSLEFLHRDHLYKQRLTRQIDNQQPLQKAFYDLCQDQTHPIIQTYQRFIKQIVMPLLGTKSVVFQKIPNLRIHAPGNVAVGEWHKDSDYGHSTKEKNVYVPLTSALESATIWAETESGKGDFQPINLWSFGNAAIWAGAVLRHGNKENMTALTRVSLDFRVLDSNDYKASDTKSVNSKLAFRIGEYFEELTQ